MGPADPLNLTASAVQSSYHRARPDGIVGIRNRRWLPTGGMAVLRRLRDHVSELTASPLPSREIDESWPERGDQTVAALLRVFLRRRR